MFDVNNGGSGQCWLTKLYMNTHPYTCLSYSSLQMVRWVRLGHTKAPSILHVIFCIIAQVYFTSVY